MLLLAGKFNFKIPFLGQGAFPVSVGEKNMLDKKAKQKIINKFKIHQTDTGSTQVQVAILTEEIRQLTEHLKRHKHDHSSRRGLLKKVGERRRLLKYLQKEDEKSFNELAKKLKLKIAKKMIEEEQERLRLEQELLAKQEVKTDSSELEEEKLAENKKKQE